MKTILVLLFIGFNASASGQGFQLTGYAGYTVPAVLKGNFGKYSLQASSNYGVVGSFVFPQVKGFPGNVNIELQYNLQNSQLELQKGNADSLIQLGGASMHTFLAGATMDFSRKQIKPFAGLMLGFTCLYPDAYTHMTRFTFSLLGGTRIALSESMGLRLQGQIYFPTVYSDPDIGLDPMAAARTGVSPGAVVVCANFSGGIYYQFKSKNRELKK